MDKKQQEQIETLITKAADAHAADDALKFSQSACNAANAMRALADIRVMTQRH